MSKGKKSTSIIRIYTIQYLIYLGAAIMFAIGIVRVKRLETLDDVLVWIWLISGTILFVISYFYAKQGSKIIEKACPHCYGTGYVDMGHKKTKRKEVCPICNGTGILKDKAEIEWEKEKDRIEKEEKNKTTEVKSIDN